LLLLSFSTWKRLLVMKKTTKHLLTFLGELRDNLCTYAILKRQPLERYKQININIERHTAHTHAFPQASSLLTTLLRNSVNICYLFLIHQLPPRQLNAEVRAISCDAGAICNYRLRRESANNRNNASQLRLHAPWIKAHSVLKK
jgi:hypothetical protein